MNEELKEITEETIDSAATENTATEPVETAQQESPEEEDIRRIPVAVKIAAVIIGFVLMLLLFHLYINVTTKNLKKPVICFHNSLADGEEMQVSVTLGTAPGSEFTFTYPEPSATDKGAVSWDVTLQGGTYMVLENGKEYPYLFWEADSDAGYEIAEGWCIKGGETVSFLEGKLTELGLDARETADFITYWAPQMTGNKYNLISFLGTDPDDTYNSAFPLTADIPARRILMVWEAVDTPVDLVPQEIPPFIHDGTYIIEWGGTEIR